MVYHLPRFYRLDPELLPPIDGDHNLREVNLYCVPRIDLIGRFIPVVDYTFVLI